MRKDGTWLAFRCRRVLLCQIRKDSTPDSPVAEQNGAMQRRRRCSTPRTRGSVLGAAYIWGRGVIRVGSDPGFIERPGRGSHPGFTDGPGRGVSRASPTGPGRAGSIISLTENCGELRRRGTAAAGIRATDRPGRGRVHHLSQGELRENGSRGRRTRSARWCATGSSFPRLLCERLLLLSAPAGRGIRTAPHSRPW